MGRAPPVQRTGNPTVRRGIAQPQPQPVHRGKPDMTSALKGDGMEGFEGFAWAGNFRSASGAGPGQFGS